jgi:hypothetical protein
LLIRLNDFDIRNIGASDEEEVDDDGGGIDVDDNNGKGVDEGIFGDDVKMDCFSVKDEFGEDDVDENEEDDENDDDEYKEEKDEAFGPSVLFFMTWSLTIVIYWPSKSESGKIDPSPFLYIDASVLAARACP